MKLWIFATVMQHRQFVGDGECVKALNLLDMASHDVPPVRDAWASLFAALNDQRNFPSTGPTTVIDERRTALLASMARELGLGNDFRPDDFARIYLPRGVVTQMQVRAMQLKAQLNALSAAPPSGASRTT